MANVSQREKISLGYNLSCFSLSNSPSRKNSEVDFSDVFGGPPRCSSSTQPNDIDDDSNDIESIDGEEYGAWFGSMEKLAFGNQTGSRKRYPSDDFYDDIFGGDQPLLNCSLTHSPRVVVPGRNPGSRTMSPSRPSSVSEPSSSPSKFRLPPGRMTNPDVMTSTSMNQNFKYFRRSLSRLNHTIPSHSSLNGDDDRNSYQSNSLFRQASVDEKDLTSDRKVNGTTDQHEAVSNVKDSRGSKFANDNLQFHFSIYKWANKGVPMVMSSRKRSPSGSKERSTSDANMVMDSKKGFVDVNGSLSSSKRRLSPTPNTRELENRDDKDKVVGGMSVECALGGDKAESPTIEVGEACGKGPVGVKEFPVHPETVSDAKKIEHASKIRKSNTKILHSLFGEEKEGNKKATAGKGRKQTKVSETKKPNQKNDTLSKICRKSKVRESFTREKDGRHRDEVPTKAKDYVPFLNEDYFSQVKSSVTGQSHSDKCTTGFEVRSEVNSYSTTNHDEMQDFYVNLEKTWSEFIEMVDGEAFQSEEHEYNINNGSNVAGSASNDEPNIDGISASDPKTSATTVNDNLGKGLEQTVDSQSATESQEETQLYERKVRQWSKGKEGNIRALLSTMQNVLWPNSGWKPIPLVDIIEANAVKKAYQRALLCLHPDKLQQKGAAPYQKLIAGKMFDILQEAWEQFNSLGML